MDFGTINWFMGTSGELTKGAMILMEAGRDIDDVAIGDKASFAKMITETDVALTLAISGDCNPLHFNEEYAKTTPFKGRIVHGTIILNLLSALLGTKLPGSGTVLHKLSVKYVAPVRVGETITVEAEVIERDVERNLLTLKVRWANQRGKEVASGTTIVMPPIKHK